MSTEECDLVFRTLHLTILYSFTANIIKKHSFLFYWVCIDKLEKYKIIGEYLVILFHDYSQPLFSWKQYSFYCVTFGSTENDGCIEGPNSLLLYLFKPKLCFVEESIIMIKQCIWGFKKEIVYVKKTRTIYCSLV